jgi:hypothetical protein
MKCHIFIITHSPFTKRDYNRYGIEILQKFFKVEVLDCTPWLESKFWNEYSNISYKFSGYTPIFDWNGYKKQIAGKTRGVAIICLHGDISGFQRIGQPLREQGILLAIERLAIVPEVRINNLFQKLYFSYKQRILFNQILKKINPAPKVNIDTKSTLSADIAILSGSDCMKDPHVMQATHSIWAHSFDYDVYLNHKYSPSERNDPYAVFLDENMIYNNDYEFIGINPPATEKKYYNELNNFFTILKTKTEYKVIVAAHPSSDYENRPHSFVGQEIIFGKTAELVRDAQLVFCHASTSISYAVLWNKPMVFLTTNELDRSFLGPMIAFRSRLFHSPLINISDIDKLRIDLNVWMQINKFDYVDYKERYLKKTGTPDIPTWQIFSDYLRQNLK